MELKDCSVFLLAKTSQAGYKFWANYIADEKVTTVQAMFLILLTSEDGQTSRQLGAYSKLDSATVSGVIDRLQAMKLVKRKPSPTDRRSSLIFLEQEGVKKGQILTEKFETAHHQFLSSFSEEEKNLLKSLLTRVLTEHSDLL
jgi:DNA-binding MarR family transcriptional regulator